MMPSRARQDGSGELRRRIDRAVFFARGVMVVALAAGWLTAAATITAILAAFDLASGGDLGLSRLPPAARVGLIVAVSAAPTAWLWRFLLRRVGWPRRLSIALATEAAHPVLGETLSRAVGFLSDAATAARPCVSPPERPAADIATTADQLRQLALDQAAVAVSDTGGLVVPGGAVGTGCVVAGLVSVLALWWSATADTTPWSAAVRRQVLGPASAAARQPGSPAHPTAPSRAAPAEVTATATRLASAAAFEQRLAAALAERFSVAPGVPAAALPRSARRELEELARLQAAALRDIAASHQALRTLARSPQVSGPWRDGVGLAMRHLDEPDPGAMERMVVEIAANRLQLAGEQTQALAAALAGAATALGGVVPVVRTEDGVPGLSGPWSDWTGAIERIDGERRSGPSLADRSEAAAADDAATPTTVQATTAASTVEPSAAGTKPGAGPTSAGIRRAGETAATDVERVWRILATSEPAERGRAVLDMTPSTYQPAIDAYYQLLLQSFPASAPEQPSADVPGNPE